MTRRRWFHPLAEFLGHVVVGTGIFVIIFAAAALIDFLVKMAAHWLSPWLFYTAEGVAIFMAIIDVAVFAVFLVKAAMRAVKNL